jgi:hypothetical protein
MVQLEQGTMACFLCRLLCSSCTARTICTVSSVHDTDAPASQSYIACYKCHWCSHPHKQVCARSVSLTGLPPVAALVPRRFRRSLGDLVHSSLCEASQALPRPMMQQTH